MGDSLGEIAKESGNSCVVCDTLGECTVITATCFWNRS